MWNISRIVKFQISLYVFTQLTKFHQNEKKSFVSLDLLIFVEIIAHKIHIAVEPTVALNAECRVALSVLI